MLVGVTAAVEVVVVASVRPREPLRWAKPVGGSAPPRIAEHGVGLNAGVDRGGMIGDQGERVERNAEVGRTEKLRQAVCPGEIPPLPPGGLTLLPCIGFGEIAKREEVPDPHQPDIRMARLHRMAADRYHRVARHRFEQFAAVRRKPLACWPRHELAVILQPQHAQQLPGKLHRIGIGHAHVAKPPAEVAEVGRRGIDHLHRPRQSERLFHRLWVPASAGRLDRKPEHAADTDRGIPRADDLRLRLQFGDPRNRPLLATHADVPKPCRTTVVLQGDEPRERLAADCRHLQLIDVLNHTTVERDPDARAHHRHLERVPLAGGAQGAFQRGHIPVERPTGMCRG